MLSRMIVLQAYLDMYSEARLPCLWVHTMCYVVSRGIVERGFETNPALLAMSTGGKKAGKAKRAGGWEVWNLANCVHVKIS